MSGHVLIVDSVASRRVLMRASLRAAHYDVSQSAEAAQAPSLVAAAGPDVLLLDVGEESRDAIAAIGALRDRPAAAPGLATPVIALTPPDRPDLRIAALRAGADQAIDRGASDRLLQARIRSLLRARDDAAELGLREDGEDAVRAAPPATALWRVAIVVAAPAGAGLLPPSSLARLADAIPSCEVSVLSSGDDLGDPRAPVPDLFVIDGAAGDRDPATASEVLRLLADLRSRSITRHAATLVVVPETAVETAAMALDLGAGDVVGDAASPAEIAARARALMSRKSEADRLRDRIQSRLQAALRDPLTGLYNRRYAEPMLERMAARARAAGSEVAMMLLDIDHFKAINDTHGHAAGDRVLTEVARRLQGAVRGGDLVARIGGEEFLVAMPDATPGQARAAAERLRRVIEQRLFVIDAPSAADLAAGPAPDAMDRAWMPAFGLGGLGGRTPGAGPLGQQVAGCLAQDLPRPANQDGPALRVTLSVGVAVGPEGAGGTTALADLFKSADDALYAAKMAGRNRVWLAPAAA